MSQKRSIFERKKIQGCGEEDGELEFARLRVG